MATKGFRHILTRRMASLATAPVLGGEPSELNKILSQMLNDRDDLRDRQNSVNTGSLKMKKTRGVSVEM